MQKTPEIIMPPHTPPTANTASPFRERRNASEARKNAGNNQRWKRNLGFLLGVIILCGLTIVIFTNTGSTTGRTTAAKPQQTTTSIPTAATASANASATVVAAQTHDYSLPGPNPGVMQPVVDQQGNIWFGEMFANALARLDPRTGAVATWTPPHGQFNIMALALDQQGNIWFAEQAANYIGRFNPTTQQFTTYPLAETNGHTAAPQDLKFDATGNLWFTEVNSGRIGRLNPQTGAISTWAIPAPDAKTTSLPFCLAVTTAGQVWFGDLSGGAVGRLDPATGAVQLYRLADHQAEVYAMNTDTHGIIWFTELQGGKLGRIDTTSNTVAEITVPTAAGAANGIYALQVARNGDIWFAAAGANALVRYAPTTHAFVFYQLAIASSIPFGLAFDGAGNLWFTASINPNYIGMLALA